MQGAALRHTSAFNVILKSLPKNVLDILNWINRFAQRIEPLLLKTWLDDLFQNCVAQIVFVFEMMKQGTFGCTGGVHNVVQAAALEAVFVKLIERGVQDFSARNLRSFCDAHTS